MFVRETRCVMDKHIKSKEDLYYERIKIEQ